MRAPMALPISMTMNPGGAGASAYWNAFHPLRVVERAFDLIFSAAANPWRHLGALGFFFFWIVAASGIYLYIFFDTSVGGAYRSVEELTNDPWYAGGVMRSLHRYASDAMMLCIILHLVRELAARRFAGFRWFSWVSGVPLVWFLLASGVVGYWLVWDEVAQFIAVATLEWFDALPIFSEPLVRNIVIEGNLTDRLFSLLMFLHIGLPLLLLAGMFVHIQRVNHADVTPPRVLAWGTFTALIALSLAMPAASQPAADLSSAVVRAPLDWFYLALYPLIYQWSPAAVWALVAALTLGLLALPVLVRGARAPVAQVDLVNCNGCGRCFADCPYAAVVMRSRASGRASQRHAVVIPGLCASCGICAGACPSSTPFRSSEPLVTGIDMPQQPIDSVRRALEQALLNVAPHPARRVVVFGCECGATAATCGSPGVATFSLLCIGMLPPAFIEYALREGADGVLIAACREGECEYRLGARWLKERLAGAREPHLKPTVPTERIRFVYAGRGEEAALQREVARLKGALAGLPRNTRRLSSRDKTVRSPH